MSQEEERPWSRIVEGDQIFSEKTGRWYEVRGIVSIRGTTRVKVFARGIPKGFEREAKDVTKVRRGPTGDAVDIFQIIFSGQTARDIPESEKP